MMLKSTSFLVELVEVSRGGRAMGGMMRSRACKSTSRGDCYIWLVIVLFIVVQFQFIVIFR